MKISLSIRFLSILLIGIPVSAQTLAPSQASQVLERKIEAPSLDANLLGDEATKRVLIYLPPGYEEQFNHRYPVLYVLHGIFDEPDVWIGHFGIPAILDRLIEQDGIPPLIAVLPQGGNQLGGGFYRNSPVSGNWGDFIASDLTAYVDSNFRTDARRERRAVIGHSMGGYGAIHLGMTRPEVFSAAYAMSPCCLTPVEDLGQGNPVWRRLEGTERWDQVQAAVQARDFYLVAALGILTAFLPNTERPPFFIDIPFGVQRGETVIREEIYGRWEGQFPLLQLDQARDALLSLNGLAMDYGIGDQFAHIPVGTRLFSERLAELRIPHTLEVYRGDHRQEIARRLEKVILPWVARLLGETSQ